MSYAVIENRGTRYEVAIGETEHGPFLALLNFGACMRLPRHWRSGLAEPYICEKLNLNEADAEGVRIALEKLAESP